MDNGNIRNFVIIAHIDHGKSTLADRFLEVTNTISERKMRSQYLDQLELERERGITIKMAPVRMVHHSNRGTTQNGPHESAQVEYILNLIDTPGHSDFSYEVSRALKAVEGAILLVDATQGIQAQTLANLESAKNAGLTIIGALNKIDMNPQGADELSKELAELIGVPEGEIHRVSGKTGEGVGGLLDAVVDKIPPPKIHKEQSALIFSSLYDDHKGIIAFVRVFGGSFSAGIDTGLCSIGTRFKIKEVGIFSPELVQGKELSSGEIGYIATGIKDPDAIKIGDTIGSAPLPGFHVPNPVVFVSLYPHDADEYDDLKTALDKLRLNDSSLVFSPEGGSVLGRGFKCGFLGRLHFEITMQRLSREFGLDVLNSFPSVAYRVTQKGGESVIVENPKDFPDDYASAEEPYVHIRILAPAGAIGQILELTKVFRMRDIETDVSGDKAHVSASLPLADLISDFDDKLKSSTRGFASFSYEFSGYKPADVRRLDILIAGEQVHGLSRIVPSDAAYSEGRTMATKLMELLPRQQFAQAIQAVTGGKILARETIPAMQKNVTGHLYGGDRTRKMKLWEKQKKGKKNLRSRGTVSVPPDVFKELLKR